MTRQRVAQRVQQRSARSRADTELVDQRRASVALFSGASLARVSGEHDEATAVTQWLRSSALLLVDGAHFAECVDLRVSDVDHLAQRLRVDRLPESRTR